MRPATKVPAHRQHGIAAVELALVLPLLVMLLALPLFLGRLFWHYSAIQKAAQNAVRYLSSAPLADMKSATRASSVVRITREIAQAHLAELNPGTLPATIDVQCDGVPCDGYSTPATVRVFIRVPFEDVFFPDITQTSSLLTADSSMAYVGK